METVSVLVCNGTLELWEDQESRMSLVEYFGLSHDSCVIIGNAPVNQVCDCGFKSHWLKGVPDQIAS